MSITTEDMRIFSDLLEEFPGVTADAQRTRMHQAMCRRGFITVFEAQRYLGAPDPRPRKMELVRLGVPVLLAWDRVVTEAGTTHRVGKYFIARDVAAEVTQ